MKTVLRLLAITTLALLAISVAQPSHAAQNPAFYLRTDKAAYVPGDSGNLLITIRNEGDETFTIKNMTITFPWLSYINDHWDGNVTINNINTPLASQGGTYNTQQSFTIPNDGRARTGQGTVRIGTDIGGFFPYRSGTFTVVLSSPTYTPLAVSTSIFSIVLIGILAIATMLLFMVHQGLKRTRPTATH